MKRILLTVSVLTAFMAHAVAQSGTFSYGAKVGPTLNWAGAASTNCQSKGAALGLGVGFVADYHLSDFIAVSSGLEYNWVRLKQRFDDYRRMDGFLEYSVVATDRRVSASYFEVPLKVKARKEFVDDLTGFAEAGVGLGLNLGARAKDEFSFYGIDYADTKYVDKTYQYRLLQASLRLGLGVEYAYSADYGLFAQLSFRHAFSNMFTKELRQRTGSNMKVNFIGIEVGVMF